jgi:hypothetical protein
MKAQLSVTHLNMNTSDLISEMGHVKSQMKYKN